MYLSVIKSNRPLNRLPQDVKLFVLYKYKVNKKLTKTNANYSTFFKYSNNLLRIKYEYGLRHDIIKFHYQM